MKQLLKSIRQCDVCENHLPLGSRPIIDLSPSTKILLMSQAPGRVVHQSGVAWQDQSGKKLRDWLGVAEEVFYNTANFGILPLGFCYPGKAKTGDLPPRKECARLWHHKVLSQLKSTPLKIIIGSYSANYYLPKDGRNLTERVQHFEAYLPEYWPIPHPSPVNRFWRAKNLWFEKDIVPHLQREVAKIIQR